VLPAVFSRSHLIACLAEVGDFAEGLRRSDEAVSLAEATNHPDTLLWAYYGAGFLHLIQGNPRQATDALEQAFSVCRANDMPVYVPRISAALGLAHALSGDAVKAIPVLERAAADAASRKQAASYPQVVLLLGEVYMLGHWLGKAADAATRALDLFRQQRERAHEASALRLLADLACQGDPVDLTAAEALYRQSLALAEELGMRPLAARCRLGFGRLYKQRGDRHTASEHLTAAGRELENMGMELWLGQARSEQSTLA